MCSSCTRVALYRFLYILIWFARCLFHLLHTQILLHAVGSDTMSWFTMSWFTSLYAGSGACAGFWTSKNSPRSQKKLKEVFIHNFKFLDHIDHCHSWLHCADFPYALGEVAVHCYADHTVCRLQWNTSQCSCSTRMHTLRPVLSLLSVHRNIDQSRCAASMKAKTF